MASPGPSSPPARGSTRRRTLAASNAGALPPEVLFDVLLRLTAKELCRLRTVCRYWRSLTSDPLFIRAHASRHPLLLVNFRDDQTHIHVVDLSGNVVKRIPIASGHQLLPTSLDLACVATLGNSCRVLNPATGSVDVLPEISVPEHAHRENLRKPDTSFAFGRISTTGEYKVLRIFNRHYFSEFDMDQLFEVFTINSASSYCSGHAQWRARQGHDYFVEASSAIVVGEVVYFKVDTAYDSMISAGINTGINPDFIISFDLEREELRGALQGPLSDIFGTDEDNGNFDEYRAIWSHLTLSDLRGSLALVHYRNYRHIMDLWLLKNFENGLWVKEYSIETRPIFPTIEWHVKTLFMLDDGRLVIHFAKTGLLFIYDSRTNTAAQVEMRHLNAVAVYTGNLLTLQVGDMA